jgi:hypothetical protein
VAALIDLREIAHRLDGEVAGGQVLAPGPAHDRRDRSLSVKLSASAPDGFVVYSFAGDDWRLCMEHVRAQLGLARPDRRARQEQKLPTNSARDRESDIAAERAKARWLWRRRRSPDKTIAEVYLRDARGYGGVIPPTLAFLPANDMHEASLIAALGMPTEVEHGVLAIADDAVMAVQLVKLKPDGSGKADLEPNRIIIGKYALGSPIVVAPTNDLLGLALAEGFEDALSISEATGLGSWASGGATRLPALAASVPGYTDFVTIVAHSDAAGRAGAEGLAAFLRRRKIQNVIKFLDRET